MEKMQLASLSEVEVYITWNARLPLLHAPPGGHGHAPVTLVVLQQHPAPRLVVFHHLTHYIIEWPVTVVEIFHTGKLTEGVIPNSFSYPSWSMPTRCATTAILSLQQNISRPWLWNIRQPSFESLLSGETNHSLRTSHFLRSIVQAQGCEWVARRKLW